MTGDPLTDILTLAGARCLYSGTLAAGGAWALRFPPPGLIKITAVVRGACWLAVDGEDAPRRLAAGDVVMLPPERPYRLAGDLDAPAADGLALFRESGDNRVMVGDGGDFLAVGGHVTLHPEHGGALRDVLPPVLRIDGEAPEAAVLRWLLDQLVSETDGDRPGAALVSEQLAQLLFVQIIRAHLAVSGASGLGWIAALGDARIAPALRLMHGEPGRAWRLGELARAVGMSRTSFAVRFKAVAGVAPLTYLLNWRMSLAARRLRDGATPVSALALSLGYTSESAFSSAFKRKMGVAPQRYRSGVADRVTPAPSAAR